MGWQRELAAKGATNTPGGPGANSAPSAAAVAVPSNQGNASTSIPRNPGNAESSNPRSPGNAQPSSQYVSGFSRALSAASGVTAADVHSSDPRCQTSSGLPLMRFAVTTHPGTNVRFLAGFVNMCQTPVVEGMMDNVRSVLAQQGDDWRALMELAQKLTDSGQSVKRACCLASIYIFV